MGRNKEKDRSDHVARPLSSLQNPASFAPPPKRVPGQPLPPPSRPNATSPGAPPPPYDDSNRYVQQQQEPEEEAPPPQPYRVNTTGLSTSHLPPPPGRKDGADGRTPSPGQAAGAARPPPSLPPRLPPRTPSASSTVAAPPASSSGGYLNQNAMNRLGAAGVSVPALGIGKPAPPEPPTRSNASSPAPPSRAGAFSPPAGQMGELQNRFAKLGKSSSGQSSSPPPPAEGTTMEQKQAALRTASNFHKDPSSVSLADARSAASTFNNFRQRHGEQVAAGVKSANNLNQKYGIADKVGNYAGQINQQQQQQQQSGAANAGQGSSSPLPGLVNALGKKKPPPPPPPKKKPQLGGAPQPPPPGPGDDDAPPPIPLATKPTF